MLADLLPNRGETRSSFPGMGWAEWQSLFSFNGSQYQTSPYKSQSGRTLIADCGPAFSVLDRRLSVMGEARPMYQRLERGLPTELFSLPSLEIMRTPWPTGSFRQLVAQCEVDVAAGGNSYWINPTGRELVRLEPDWVTIVTERFEVDSREVGDRLIGYAVQQPGHQPTLFEPQQVAHYKPGAPNMYAFRGESWLASVSDDASSDIEMTRYKGQYLRNGAMPSLVVMYEPTMPADQIEQFVDVFKEKFVGHMNAGKVMHLLGGRDVKTVGATLDQLAFKAVQGAGETRIAAAAGVPAVVAGFSEGMQGSSLNAGNYVATRRLFADAKIRPLLGSLFDAFSVIVPVPGGSRLWYDDSGVSFFQEDVKDEAEIRHQHAATTRTLIEAGFDPDSVVQAVVSGNFASLVGKHSGLTSVQLQPAADSAPEPPSSDEGNPPNDQPQD